MASGYEMAEQANKIVGGQPAYNNPIAIPRDEGPIDISVACAKHGRTQKGTATVPFRRESKKGEKSVVGETFWGKHHKIRDRYLIVQASAPYYLSRTALEDNDDFSSDAGWYRDVHCVAVEPTEQEAGEDAAKAKAKADKEAATARRKEITNLVRQGENHTHNQLVMTGMVRCWGEQRMAGSELMYSDGVNKLVYITSDYDMGPSCCMLENASLAAEATALTTKEKI